MNERCFPIFAIKLQRGKQLRPHRGSRVQMCYFTAEENESF
jgi:hypothetical protein